MSIDIRMPNITAPDSAGQLAQMRSYLYQFAEQLQWALNTMGDGVSSQAIELKNSVGELVEKTEEAKAQDTFNSIKDLIIKSADIVEAYYEQIELLHLKGEYVAQSEFGNYTEKTDAKLEATSENITAAFTRVGAIEGDVNSILEQDGYIKCGWVKTTLSPTDVIGIEMGDFRDLDGVTSRRFATFSSAGIELYGEHQDIPIATISKTKITITSAEFAGSVKMGKYRLDLSNGIAFKWEGG